MMRYLVPFLLISTAAAAQQQPPDPAFMARAAGALQQQRNQALDLVASLQARAEGLAEELAKANARIKEFEAKEPKPAGPKK